MKTIILAAVAVALVAIYANKFDRPASARMVTPVAAATAPVSAPAQAEPPTIYVSEITITAEVPRGSSSAAAPRRAPQATHAETDAEHVMRLMSAPLEPVSCAGCTPRKPFETMSGRVSRLSPELY